MLTLRQGEGLRQLQLKATLQTRGEASNSDPSQSLLSLPRRRAIELWPKLIGAAKRTAAVLVPNLQRILGCRPPPTKYKPLFFLPLSFSLSLSLSLSFLCFSFMLLFLSAFFVTCLRRLNLLRDEFFLHQTLHHTSIGNPTSKTSEEELLSGKLENFSVSGTSREACPDRLSSGSSSLMTEGRQGSVKRRGSQTPTRTSSSSSSSTSSIKTKIVQVLPASLRRKRSSISTSDSPVDSQSTPVPGSSPDDEIEAETSNSSVTSSLPSASTQFNFFNDLIWNIDGVLYIGAKEASWNATLLCRMNIGMTIDLSSLPKEERHTAAQCMCPTRHFCVTMTVDLPEHDEETGRPASAMKTNWITVFANFESILGSVKKTGRNILAFSRDCRNRAPAFAVAYLMYTQRLARVQAFKRVKDAMEHKRPAICISDYLQRTLVRYQMQLGIESPEHGDPEFTVPLFNVKRHAWS